MMVFAYALYAPAGISLTSAYASQLVADTLHVTIGGWVLFLVILGAVVLVAYLGIRTSSSVDLSLSRGKWPSSRRWPSRSWSRSVPRITR